MTKPTKHQAYSPSLTYWHKDGPKTWLGLDPGFSNVGWCKIVTGGAGDRVRLVSCGVITTEKTHQKANEDIKSRAHDISYALNNNIIGCNFIAAEAMSFPRSSSVAAKMATTWGIIYAISQTNCLPTVLVTPQEIKRKCSAMGASKEDIMGVMRGLFPNAEALLEEDRVIKSKRNHAYDAMAAVVTSLILHKQPSS